MAIDPIDKANELTDLAPDRDKLEDEVDRLPKHLLRPTLVELAAMRAADRQRIKDTDVRDALGEFGDDERNQT